MTYLELVNSYWVCHRHYGLSNGATALYFLLLDRFNGARWPDQLKIGSIELQGSLRVCRKTFYRHVSELVECGILEASLATGRSAQVYKLMRPTIGSSGVQFDLLEIERETGDREPDRVKNSLNEKLREPDREPVREPDRVNNALTYNSIDKDKDKEITPTPSGIDAIYAIYPKKVGKPAALRAIRRALQTTPQDRLLALTQQYADCVKGADPKYLPNPATFYNQERYLDDPSTWSRSDAAPSQQEVPAISPRQRLMVLQDQQRRLREDMPRYRERHRSECAGGSYSWDPGSRETYNGMAAKLKAISAEIDRLVCPQTE